MVWDRQHVELLDPMDVTWKPDADATICVLSRDESDGAITAIDRLPAGSQPQWPSDQTVEYYVLAGSIVVDGRQLGSGGYGLHPAGTPIALASQEATVLLFTYGAETRPAIAPIDSETIPWGQPRTDKQNQGLFSKTLRSDPATGERLFLLRTHGGQADPRIEWHDCVEEIYQVTGATIMAGPNQPFDLSAGRYCYRPPLIPHGGFETVGGPDGSAMMLVRVNSTLVNHYVERDEANRMLRRYGPGLDPRMVPG